MDKKFKILVIPSDRTGVGYWRSVQPHTRLQEMYPSLFEVDIRYIDQLPTTNQESFFSQYDLVHMHKQLDKSAKLINMIKFLGAKVVVDIDDHWDLGNYHPMSHTAKAERWDLPIKEHLKLADYVTTTTSIFANEIKKLNTNICVLPNAINPNEEQFIPKPTESRRIRFGVICGSSHKHDLELLNGMVNQLPQSYLDKVQFVLCGFDTNGTRTIHHLDTGRIERRPILPKESVWYEYEKILTNNYKIVSEDHKRFLEMFLKQTDYPNLDEPYRRCWTKDISQYATHYNNIDALLVPLKECPFNKVKSQLKVIEAGFFHKAIIAQNYGPYTIDLKPMIKKGGEIDENGNALLVDSSKNHKQWAKYIKWIVDNPSGLVQLQNNLYNTVKDEYDIDTVTKNRARLYLDMLGANDTEV